MNAYTQVLTRILNVGVRDSPFTKRRSPSQKVGASFPKIGVPFFFMTPLIVKHVSGYVTSFLRIPDGESFFFFSYFFLCDFFFPIDFGLCLMFYSEQCM